MILLDTHVVAHYVTDDTRLGRHARATIKRALARNAVFVSAISFWEIAMLVARGRFKLKESLRAFRATILGKGIQELPVNTEIAMAAGELPRQHDDPADRMIVATAMERGFTLLTADEALLMWRMSGYRTLDESA